MQKNRENVQLFVTSFTLNKEMLMQYQFVTLNFVGVEHFFNTLP
jgi:hypothetical protein